MKLFDFSMNPNFGFDPKLLLLGIPFCPRLQGLTPILIVILCCTILL
jgi:hypothetical protein